MSNPSIKPQEKALYSILCVYCGDKRECFPSISTLADIMDLSQRQVNRLIKNLKIHGIIARKGRKILLLD
jgi:predicted transcriptional regulator|tara:strand:+ start:76 stop:285 length:210 start_codon:yes stop_codon:yes gene_type:complete